MPRPIALLALAILFTSASAQSVIVEEGSAVSAQGVLVQDVGIESLGGVFTPLLKAGCKVPCSTTQVFTTGDDRQTEIKIHVFRGRAKLSKDAMRLGIFAITGVPEMPRGQPEVAVTFIVEREGITLSALEKQEGRALTVVRREF